MDALGEGGKVLKQTTCIQFTACKLNDSLILEQNNLTHSFLQIGLARVQIEAPIYLFSLTKLTYLIQLEVAAEHGLLICIQQLTFLQERWQKAGVKAVKVDRRHIVDGDPHLLLEQVM